MEAKCFFQFEIIINVLVSSFRLIWIPILWVYDLKNVLIVSMSKSPLDDRIRLLWRQILTSLDGPRDDQG